MHHNSPEEFLGVDVGASRIGVARGSDIARLAQPLKTVDAAQAVGELKELADEHQAAGIVVGLPRNLEGRDTAQTQVVRDWVKAAKAEIGRPFFWQDEALTSREAAGKLQTSNFKNQTYDEHAAAAAIILQDFLDADKDDRVVA